MNDVILNVLDGFNNVADQPGVGGDLDFQSIFDSSHGAECMYSRSDTADALGKRPGIARVPPFQNDFNPTPHGAG